MTRRKKGKKKGIPLTAYLEFWAIEREANLEAVVTTGIILFVAFVGVLLMSIHPIIGIVVAAILEVTLLFLAGRKFDQMERERIQFFDTIEEKYRKEAKP
jgi:phosphotransferase system  glucose/maltose/N-acetylglucosamine-specific IIC component